MPQIKNEQLSNIVRKVQGECEFVLKQASAAAEKQEILAAQLTKLTKSLEQTEERIKKSQHEAKVGYTLYKRFAECASQQWSSVPLATPLRVAFSIRCSAGASQDLCCA